MIAPDVAVGATFDEVVSAYEAGMDHETAVIYAKMWMKLITPNTTVQKFNHNHGDGGLFASGPGGSDAGVRDHSGVLKYNSDGSPSNMDTFIDNRSEGVPERDAGNALAAKSVTLMDQAGVLRKPLEDSYTPITVLEGKGDPSEGGEYDPNEDLISINSDFVGAGNEFSFIHEYAHYMDYNSFPTSPTSLIDDPLVSEAGKAGNGPLADWWKAVDGTSEFQRLNKENSAFAEYARDPSEVFARSVAQYVAKKTGNSGLLDGLKATQKAGIFAQWSDKDFQPVYDALDKVFNGSEKK